MQNKDYKPVQIPNESYDRLKEFCSENGYKMGKFLEILIERNCIAMDKKKILRVD